MNATLLAMVLKEGFTCKERDSESEKDYFGARYFGRWPGQRLNESHPGRM
jgi:hypothetical protein